VSNQRLAAGGYLDLLTKQELKETMGHSLDDAIVKWYRGVDYLTFVGNATPNSPSTGIYTIPWVPEQGYAWAVKIVAFTMSSSAQTAVYQGTDITQAPVAFPGFNATAVATFSSNQLVIKDGSPITLFAAGGSSTILNWRLHVKQVPTEMQGKL
jgi:hypothetical protein